MQAFCTHDLIYVHFYLELKILKRHNPGHLEDLQLGFDKVFIYHSPAAFGSYT